MQTVTNFGTGHQHGIRNTEDVTMAIERFNDDAIIIAYVKAFGIYNVSGESSVLELKPAVAVSRYVTVKYIRVEATKDLKTEPSAYRTDMLYGMNNILWFGDPQGQWHSSSSINNRAKVTIIKRLTERAVNWIAKNRNIKI